MNYAPCESYNSEFMSSRGIIGLVQYFASYLGWPRGVPFGNKARSSNVSNHPKGSELPLQETIPRTYKLSSQYPSISTPELSSPPVQQRIKPRPNVFDLKYSSFTTPMGPTWMSNVTVAPGVRAKRYFFSFQAHSDQPVVLEGLRGFFLARVDIQVD
jgi:hypothetical protein